MDRAATLRYVAQEDARAQFRTLFGSDWVTVDASIKSESQDTGIGSALVPRNGVARVLRRADWDFIDRHDSPGFITSGGPNKEDVTTYHRFGNDEGSEPLVIHRSFHGVRPATKELCEEFRLFHNLFWMVERGEFVRFEDNADEEPVVRITSDRVQVRRRALLEYITAKDMALVLLIDQFRYGMVDPVLRDDEALVEDVTEENMIYSFHRSDARYIGYEDRNVFSRLLGKVLIQGGPQWAFSPEPKEGRYEEFIIGVDESGKDVQHTSDPDLLANYFGANPDAPHYLTPVFFRREVLQKYYSDPTRYEVSDCYLSCRGLWGLRMDNDHERYVIVWLGDLGRDLPERERPYWKSFNVRPDGHMSETYFRRAIHADFAEATSEEHVFKAEYERTVKRWNEEFGWPLFRPLADGDEHLIMTLHVPLTNSTAEFEEQLMALTKLVVDYLNETALANGASTLPPDAKGIDKLKAFLEVTSAEGSEGVIAFLRNLQALRSSGAAHAKGRNYERARKRFKIGSDSNTVVFRSILAEAIGALRVLASVRAQR